MGVSSSLFDGFRHQSDDSLFLMVSRAVCKPPPPPPSRGTRPPALDKQNMQGDLRNSIQMHPVQGLHISLIGVGNQSAYSV